MLSTCQFYSCLTIYIKRYFPCTIKSHDSVIKKDQQGSNTKGQVQCLSLTQVKPSRRLLSVTVCIGNPTVTQRPAPLECKLYKLNLMNY